MSAVTDAIIPLVLLTLFGSALRAFGFLDDQKRQALESFVYFILVPALIVSTLIQVDLDPALVIPLVPIVLVPLLANIALMAIMRAMPFAPRVSWLDGPRYASVAMGVSRNNLFVVLAASQALLDVEGAALAAIAAAIFMPFANAYGVYVCMRHGTAGAGSVWKTLLELGSNPFISGTIVGIALNLSGIGLPGPLAPAASLLSDSSLGVALVIVGAGLRLRGLGTSVGGLAVSAAIKLILQPLIGLGLCMLLRLPPEAALAAAFYHAGPTAPGAYILARKLGADADLMAAIITGQTILAAFTMPVMFILIQHVVGLN